METLMKRTEREEVAEAKAEESSEEMPIPEVADITFWRRSGSTCYGLVVALQFPM